jgi:serine/threonine-protein kinase
MNASAPAAMDLDQEVRQHLAKLVASPLFAAAGKRIRFLTFLVERALAGDADSIKEYLIGVEVYDRPEGYDPRTDPIVRVEASRLRAKLLEYYETAGKDDPIRILLPKGRYVPVFEDRRKTPIELPVSIPSKPARAWIFAASILAIMALLGAGWYSSRPKAEANVFSIAVRPLVGLSPDAETAALASGISEELTTELAKIPGLRITELAGAKRAQGHVLEGTVRREGQRVRVAMKLIDMAEGYHLWAETYERDLTTSFEAQPEIARLVARTVGRLSGAKLRHTPTDNPKAFDLYLKAYRNFRQVHPDEKFTNGRSALLPSIPEELRQSVRLFEEAVRLDPKFAEAWAGLADACWTSSDYDAAGGAQLTARAMDAAAKAIALNDAIEPAHAVKGEILRMRDWDFTGAEREFRRAIELNPRRSSTQRQLAQLLIISQRFELAEVELNRALTFDPDSPVLISGLGWLHYRAGRYDAALEQIRRALALNNAHAYSYWLRGLVFQRMKQYKEAEQAFRMSLQNADYDLRVTPALGNLYAASGRRAEALAILKQVQAKDQAGVSSAYSLALIHTGLGDKAKALDLLEKAYEARENSVPYLMVDPRFEGLRKEPRFTALFAKLKIPAL